VPVCFELCEDVVCPPRCHERGGIVVIARHTEHFDESLEESVLALVGFAVLALIAHRLTILIEIVW
jgi:hypothetical protein